MKNILLIVIITFLLFSSCGEETVINPGSPAGTVFFSLDSVSIWLEPGSMGGGAGGIYQHSFEASKIKVEYRIQTNADSLHSEAWLRDSSYGSTSNVIYQYFYRNTDSLITYTFNFPTLQIYLNLDVTLHVYSSTIPHYIKIKDLKVIKQ